MRVFSLNLHRLALHAVAVFLLVYAAYTPEVVLNNALHDKADLFAREAGTEISSRLRSLSEASELRGVLGMIDSMTGGEGLAGLAAKTIREIIEKGLPARSAFRSPDVMQWPILGLMLVILSTLGSLILWHQLQSVRARQWCSLIVGPTIVLGAVFVSHAISYGQPLVNVDTWNTVIYGIACTTILVWGVSRRPLPYVVAGLIGIVTYGATGLIRDGSLPGYYNSTLASANVFTDVKTNLIDPKVAQLSTMPLVGPMIHDFVEQAWKSPDYQNEVEALKEQSLRAAASLRSLGYAEIFSGWAEVFIICAMFGLAVLRVSHDMSLVKSTQVAVQAVTDSRRAKTQVVPDSEFRDVKLTDDFADVDQLERLAKLYADGMITKDEFDRAKRRLLSN